MASNVPSDHETTATKSENDEQSGEFLLIYPKLEVTYEARPVNYKVSVRLGIEPSDHLSLSVGELREALLTD